MGGLVVIRGVGGRPVALLAGLSGWLLVGVLCNLVGVAVLETSREVQRGLGKFAAMMSVYVIANLIQLLGILALGALDVRAPAPFLIVYGLSSVVALALVQPVMAIDLKWVRSAISVARIREIFRFARPLLLQSVFFAVWFGSDLIMVQHLMEPGATGNYGVAKALVNVLMLAPTAIGTAVLPRIARLGERSIGKYMLAAIGLTGLATIPLVAGAALLRTHRCCPRLHDRRCDATDCHRRGHALVAVNAAFTPRRGGTTFTTANLKWGRKFCGRVDLRYRFVHPFPVISVTFDFFDAIVDGHRRGPFLTTLCGGGARSTRPEVRHQHEREVDR